MPQRMRRCKQTGVQSATHAHFLAADHFVAGLQRTLLPQHKNIRAKKAFRPAACGQRWGRILIILKGPFMIL